MHLHQQAQYGYLPGRATPGPSKGINWWVQELLELPGKAITFPFRPMEIRRSWEVVAIMHQLAQPGYLPVRAPHGPSKVKNWWEQEQ